MNYTTNTPASLPHVTGLAFAYIRANTEYANLLRATAALYGHSNREIIGRVQANLPLDYVRRVR